MCRFNTIWALHGIAILIGEGVGYTGEVGLVTLAVSPLFVKFSLRGWIF